MDAARVRSELDEIIARAKRLKEEIGENNRVDGTPVFMSIGAYAARAQVSTKTIRKWVKAGLPVVRHRNVIRIKVAEADSWTEDDATRRSAELNAHGHRHGGK